MKKPHLIKNVEKIMEVDGEDEDCDLAERDTGNVGGYGAIPN